MLIPFSTRSRFFDAIEAALRAAERCPEAGGPLTVELAPGGYDGAIVVDTSRGSPDRFEAEWERPDPTRFPARIRAAATVLHTRGCRGRYLVTHEDGSLIISPAD